jgi:hypothetical protein
VLPFYHCAAKKIVIVKWVNGLIVNSPNSTHTKCSELSGEALNVSEDLVPRVGAEDKPYVFYKTRQSRKY